MIRLMEAPTAALLEGWDAPPLQRAEIHCLLAASHQLDVWLQTDGDTPLGLIVRGESGGMTAALIPGLTDPQWAELAEFVGVAGCTALELPGRLSPQACQLFAGMAARCQPVLERLHTPSVEHSALLGEIRPIPPDRLYELACACQGQKREDYEQWLWRFSLRLRRDRALAVGLWDGGELACAGALSHIGETHAVLGYIATPPARRGQGLGRAVVGALAQEAWRRGKTPILACRSSLIHFYEQQGFAPTGWQTILLHHTETEQP